MKENQTIHNASELTVRADVIENSEIISFSIHNSPESIGKRIKLYVGDFLVGDFFDGKNLEVPAKLFIEHNNFDVNLCVDSRVVNYKQEGEYFFVTGFDTSDLFYERVQFAGTRVKSRLSIKLGSLYTFINFSDNTVKAAALTVYGHRLIDTIILDKKEIAKFDLERYIDWASNVIVLCSDEINKEEYRWDLIRWSISLATVAGNLCVAFNKLELAHNFFRFCSANSDKIATSPVSSLNIINGHIIYALLSDMLGEAEETEKALRKCIVGYKDVVISQDLLENVWVIGDLLNSAKAVRQAFILLVQLGLDERDPRHIVDPPPVEFEISALKCPIWTFIRLGYCQDLKLHLSKISYSK